jgi:prepilin-type N-terminal cleavage/methylation domain-containing protein
MIKRLQQKRQQGEGGFTLVELLVVIVILGVLASIVVFAVGGITNNSQTASCKADKKSLQSAEEAYRAQHTGYAAEADLVPGYLASQSDMYNVTLADGGYSLTVQDTACNGI